MNGTSKGITILIPLVAFLVILRTVRYRMVSAGRSVGDVACARSGEEENGPFGRLTNSKHVEHAQEREDLFTRI